MSLKRSVVIAVLIQNRKKKKKKLFSKLSLFSYVWIDSISYCVAGGGGRWR